MVRPGQRAVALALTLGSVTTVQVAASFAKSLFAATGPLTLVFLRQLTAGVILALAARPRPRGHDRRDWSVLASYCAAVVTMNIAIYQSMARIPVGLAVTIEFLGPLVVAVATGRGGRDLVWAGLAAAGVVVLGWSPGHLTLAGVGWALVAAAGWAGYILVSPAVGRRWRGVEPVAWANLAGAVILLGPVLSRHGAVLLEPWVWGAGLAIGLFNSVVPYSFELQALRHLERHVFSVLMSVEPAVAALTALVVLGEALRPMDWVAIGCVVLASVGVARSGRRRFGRAGRAPGTRPEA